MTDIHNTQLIILKRVILHNIKDFSLSSYFSTFAYNLGFYHMKLWVNKKNFFKFILAFFKEIYAMINANDYDIKGIPSNLLEFSSIVITWGNDQNVKSNSYTDRYFDSSNQDKSILWIVIFSGKKISNNDNVICIIEKKLSIYKKIKNFINFIFIFLFQRKNLHQFTYNYYSSVKLEKIFDTIIKKLKFKNSSKFFIPFESQPFQNNFIKKIKSLNNNYKIFGYIHSFPAFPSHLTRKIINPDYIIVNSKDQAYSFVNFLGWHTKEIILLPSLRFKRNLSNDLSKKIFLPINFYSIKNICRGIQELNKIYNLKEFEIRNHPVAKNSKKHKKLIDKINKIIYFNDNSKLNLKTSIFIGSTGAIIESLFNGIKPIHIMEDIEFEIYSQKLWPSINSNFIKDKIVEYKLINQNIVELNDNFSFQNYLRL